MRYVFDYVAFNSKERGKLQDLVPAPVSSMKVSGKVSSKPPVVRLQAKNKGIKDSCRPPATGNLSLPHTHNAMATLMK